MVETATAKGAAAVVDDDEDSAATDKDDSSGTEAVEGADAVEAAGVPVSNRASESKANATSSRRRISVSVRALAYGAAMVGLAAVLGVMTWLYIGAQSQLDNQARQAQDNRRAEQIALDYAVNAAIMDYQDLGPWKESLVKGTTPELKEKLGKAGSAMEQILTPLQWISSAKPLAAKVQKVDEGIYLVDTFVGVMTKTVQASDSLQSTATYSIAIDSNNGWQITDVGGIASVLSEK